MKFKKILLLGYAKGDLGEAQEKRLVLWGQKVVMLPKDSKDISKQLSDVDCLLVRLGATVDKGVIDKALDLRYVGMLGTGYGRIDTKYARSKGITVCNIAGYSTEGVAEFVFGALIENIRELERAKLQARKGNYSEATFQGYEIRNKKFGIIGMGKIGQRVAQIAQKGFNAKVSYWSKNRKKDAEKAGISYKTLEILLRESDFVSIHLAYVEETKKILSRKKIQLIKPGAVVICFVQMEVVDIRALEQRLKKEDMIFILDHSDELTPADAKSLSKYKNCILYPPVGYITKESTQAKLGMFVENIENFLKGKPQNVVN